MTRPLSGKVALVAGATRGAGRGIAVSLAEAGASVFCTGRSTRADLGRGSPGDPFELSRRPETIEETAELARQKGGEAFAVRVDHTDEPQVQALVARIEREHGRLDVVVNDVWGGDALVEWGKPAWELDPAKGFEMVERVLHTHFLTLRHALPLVLRGERGLVVEVTDGDFLGYRSNLFYDLAKIVPIRFALALSADLLTRGHRSVTALALTPGFLRSEAVLDHFGVAEANWRDAAAKDPHFAESETPYYVGRAVAALAADPNVEKKAGLVLSSWALAREYGFSDVDGRRPDWGTHIDSFVTGILERGGPKDDDERFLVTTRYFQLALDPGALELTRRMAESLGFESR